MYKAVLAFTLLVAFSTQHKCQVLAVSCTGLSDGTTLPNPDAEDEFYICIDGTPLLQKCKNGLIFSQSDGYCIRGGGSVVTPTPSITTTTAAPNLCENQANGTLFALAASCTGFIMCENSQMIYRECKDNKAFDIAIGACSQKTCSK